MPVWSADETDVPYFRSREQPPNASSKRFPYKLLTTFLQHARGNKLSSPINDK